MNSFCKTIVEKQLTRRCHYGRFIIGPFRKGDALSYGTTLRHLLLSLQGPHISAVNIRGLKHELDTSRGMKESMGQILANLRQIMITDEGVYNPISGYNDNWVKKHQLVRVYLDGPKQVTAADLQISSPFRVVDKYQHIATLDSSAHLDMILLIKSAHQSIRLPKFTNYTYFNVMGNVQAVTNVSSHILDLNDRSLQCVLLEIWTNGKLTPKRALRLSCTLACSFFTQLFFPKPHDSGGRIRTSE